MLSKWKNLKRWQKWVVVILGLAVLGFGFWLRRRRLDSLDWFCLRFWSDTSYFKNQNQD